MKRVRIVIGSLSVVLAGAVLLAQVPQSEIDAHVSAARAAAGMDFRNTFINLCLPAGGGARGAAGPGGAAAAGQAAPARGAAAGQPAAGRGAAGGRQAAPGRGAGGGGLAAAGRGGAPQTPDRAGWYAAPYKIFDNLYWLGTREHSSWALQTSAGIVLIDTNFAYATQPEIVDGLTKLGLKPADLKHVIISHAHGDHGQ